MMKKITLRKICLSIGITLILLSLVMLILWQCNVSGNSKRIYEYVHTIESLIPEAQAAVIEPRADNKMPSLNVQGNNFIAIMEFPLADVALPVGASWDKADAYPCLYSGSAYDGSLIIGTSNQNGQLEFVKDISVGNTIYLTDMTGSQFTYTVSDIQYSKHADNQALFSETADFTIFVKNIYAFEYIIIRCNAAGH